MIKRFGNFIVLISIMVVISIFSIGGYFIFEGKAKKWQKRNILLLGVYL